MDTEKLLVGHASERLEVWVSPDLNAYLQQIIELRGDPAPSDCLRVLLFAGIEALHAQGKLIPTEVEDDG